MVFAVFSKSNSVKSESYWNLYIKT